MIFEGVVGQTVLGYEPQLTVRALLTQLLLERPHFHVIQLLSVVGGEVGHQRGVGAEQGVAEGTGEVLGRGVKTFGSQEFKVFQLMFLHVSFQECRADKPERTTFRPTGMFQVLLSYVPAEIFSFFLVHHLLVMNKDGR